jgi:endonuclease YncB( thermonuclease family)
MRRALPPILIAMFVLLPAGVASAKTGRCLPGGAGPVCHFWFGKARIADGDTVEVDIDGDGTKREKPVRLIGIQAMEQSVYSSKHPERRRGECHALEATAYFDSLLKKSHHRVRLAAQHAGSHAGHRLRRSVAVKIGGHWQDVGLKQMAAGNTLWMDSTDEAAWNARYNRAGQHAAQKGIGLWNPTHCGAGPAQSVPLKLWVSWDPLGNDAQNINGEFFKIVNTSTTETVPLARWWVRDAMLRRFTFPAGAKIAPGATVTVYAGHGTSSGNSYYWGLDEPPFQNPGDSRHLGDGGYLFDPQGDLRSWLLYPCVVACSSPDKGAIDVSVSPRGRDEYAQFQNASSHAVDLYGYVMETGGSSYDFPTDSKVAPGETLTVHVNGDPADDTRLNKHWGVGGLMFPDPGGSVRLQTFSDITLGCDAWGSGSC